MKQQKILLVTGIFPPDHGGPATYVPAIATALAERHKILGVITLSDAQNHDDAMYPFPVMRILRGQNRFLRRVRTIYLIRKSARSADAVYLNGLVLEGIVACKILSRRYVAIKVVGDLIWERARNSGFTKDNIDEFQNNSYGLLWQCKKWLQGWYTNVADIIITPSHYLAGIVRGWGVSSSKVHVVYNAVQSSFPSTPANICKSVDCVTVARLVSWKGISELIDIVGQNKWTLNVVGEGPLRNELERQIAKANLTNYIKLVGHVSKAKVVEEIAKAKIFILNSTYEGLPHIILEAKAAGVPVIATAVGGTPETIHDGLDGFLVPLGDANILTEKIRFLLEHPEQRQRIVIEGLNQVREQFLFDRMVAETERLLVAN